MKLKGKIDAEDYFELMESIMVCYDTCDDAMNRIVRIVRQCLNE